MNTNSQIALLEQAQVARFSSDWSKLIHCLQQLISGGNVSASSQDSAAIAQLEKNQILDLALEVLVAGDFHQRWEIAKFFPKLSQTAYAQDPSKVISPLIEILEDEDADEELRWFAGRTLGEFNHPTVVAALVELLKTAESEELSAMAAAALGQIGTPAVAALTELLTEENIRLLAVRSLAYIRRSETITPLLRVVQDPQVAIRSTAIEALSSFHDARIPPVLLKALDDLAANVRREAVLGLGFRSDLQEELDLVNRLAPRLYDLNLDVCTATAIALGRLGSDNAATALFQVLKSPHTPEPLQLEIVRALGRIGTENSWEYLHSSLNQPLSVTVWQEIVTVLGRESPPNLTAKAAAILIEILSSGHQATQHQSIKQAIALSLGQLGEQQAIEPLIQLLADTNAGVRLHAIAALKQLNPESTYHQLQQRVTNPVLPENLRQGIAIALQEWTTQ